MNSNRIIRTAIVVALTALSAVSCVTNRKVAYLQDMQHETQIELEDKFEAVICPYDELDVIITAYDAELSRPFNLRSSTNLGSTGGIAYLVDVYGNIEIPILGKIHCVGLTRLKLQEKIKDLLISGGYINDPFVLVRFRSYKIFFLGANGGKAINISNERCTFLEALAMAGGLSKYTKRDKIAVMREIDGKMVTHFMDPRSTEIFNDPFFLLEQNDIIITQSFRRAYAQDAFSRTVSIIGSVASLISSVGFIYLTITNKKD